MSPRNIATSALIALALTGISAPVTSQAATAGGVSVSSARDGAALAAKKKSRWKYCDAWDGDWSYASQTGDGGVLPGRMELSVYHHDYAAGEYFANSSGNIKGDIFNEKHPDRPCGKHWVGKFKDTSGPLRNRGKFWATLFKDDGRWQFYGEYCVKSPSFPYFRGDYYPWGGAEID